jgi:acyl-CoA synthetase (AMP-forming)/AMP-acid ligase II
VLAENVSHWLPEAAESPGLREITVADLLDEAVARRPDGPALVYSAYGPEINLRLSYAELDSEVKKVSAALIGSGLKAGDTVLIWATNLPQYSLLQLACAYANLVLVPINPLYRHDELAFVLKSVEPSIAFLQPETKQASLWTIFDDAVEEEPGSPLRVALGIAPDERGSGWADWLGEAGTAVDAEVVAERRRGVAPENLSQIQFTSGTTGLPKGVELTNWTLANQGIQMAGRAGIEAEDSYLNPMPMFHCGGCVLAALGSLAAAATHIPIVSFEPSLICETIESEQATFLAGVPTMLLGIEEERVRAGRDLSSLRTLITGGSSVPVAITSSWQERFGVSCVITYGQTEFGPLATVTSPHDPPARQRGTVGRPIPHVELDVVEPGTDRRVAIGTEGELRYRGYVMRGYLGAPEATAEAVSPDGWLRSGDLGLIDEEGYVQITGRAKEMIIRGGENISPAAVEDAIRPLESVADVCVVGVPDEKTGEELCAFVRLREGSHLSIGELREELLPRIARFKVPRYLLSLDEFPLTPSGKIQRFRLREIFASDSDRVEDSRAISQRQADRLT